MKILHPDFNFLRPGYWFGEIDSRPLSVFRIFFALLLLKDALYHIPLSYWFFSDDGLVPREVLWDGLARINRFSLMDTLPYAWEAALFFVLWAVILVLLAVGWRTRWMTILNFIFLLSVHERNIYILTGADTVLRVMAFWAMFIPLGQYYSLDAMQARWRRYLHTHDLADLRASAPPRTAFAFPIRMIQIQLAIVYFFTWALKLPGSAWVQGDALHYALQLQTLTLPTGDWLRDNLPLPLLRLGTWYSLLAEGLFVPLVFLPLFQPFLRGVGLLLTGLMHLGIAVLMSIQDFSLVMWICYLVLFMPEWITWLDQKLRLKGAPVTVPIPARRSPLWLLLAATRADEVRVYTELQETGDPDDWALDRADGEWITGPAAWRAAAAHLPLSRLWGWTLRFRAVRRVLWNIAHLLIVRQPMPEPGVGERSRSEKSAKPTWFTHAGNVWYVLSRAGLMAALGTLMFYLIWWNVATLTIDMNNTPLPGVRGVSQPAYGTIQMLGVWQHWGMFSPYPSTVDGWIIVVGQFENGEQFDLRTGFPPATDLPRIYFGPDNRWKKYEENINRDRPEALLDAWGSYYCRRYNNELQLPLGQRLATLEIQWHYRSSVDPGQPPNGWSSDMLWRHWCFDQYAPQG
jgi:hypothetical protein